MHWIDPLSLPSTEGEVARFLFNAEGHADVLVGLSLTTHGGHTLEDMGAAAPDVGSLARAAAAALVHGPDW